LQNAVTDGRTFEHRSHGGADGIMGRIGLALDERRAKNAGTSGSRRWNRLEPIVSSPVGLAPVGRGRAANE
jgi:hypothetical protein